MEIRRRSRENEQTNGLVAQPASASGMWISSERCRTPTAVGARTRALHAVRTRHSR